MKQINNIFLKTFYESFSFIIPKNTLTSKLNIHSKIGHWSLLDSYTYIYNLKLIFAILRLILIKHTNKNKILFICDENILNVFKDFLDKYNHFYTDNLKNALDFLQQTKLAANVSVVIYIGANNELSKKSLTQLSCPVIFFAPKTKGSYDFYSPNMLSFHSSILFLKVLLIESMKQIKN